MLANTQTNLNTLQTPQQPDLLGRFGQFGGKYVPETLMPALSELEAAYQKYRNNPDFQNELQGLLNDYVGRATPLYFAERLTTHYAKLDGTGPQIYLKREDLNHTGAHKINNVETLCPQLTGSPRIVISCSGRGDKDVQTVAKFLNHA